MDYWYLFMDCKSENMLALLGTTKPRIEESESKRILEPWLTSLDITEFGIEDFDYSSGVCYYWRAIMWLIINLLLISLINTPFLVVVVSSIVSF